MTQFSFNRALLLPVLALGLCLSACNEKKVVEAEKPGRPVIAQAVKFEQRNAAQSFVGTVRPKIESDLGFRVNGKVEKRLVQVGDKVVAGQPLATLDNVDLGLQKSQADAELKAALGSRRQANAALARAVTLRKQGWTTQAAFDQLRAASDEADGRVSRDEQALSIATNALAYATLNADGEGVVTATLIEPGQVVASGVPAIRVARLIGREAVVALPEFMVDRARTARASVSLWSQSGKTYSATLRELSPSADPATRTYQARFTIADAGPEVEFGMTANVTLSEDANNRIARLPLASLYNDGKGTSLWVVDTKTGAIVLKPVNVAGYDAEDVLIRDGVNDGDMVVTLGVQKLDAGQKVRILTSAL